LACYNRRQSAYRKSGEGVRGSDLAFATVLLAFAAAGCSSSVVDSVTSPSGGSAFRQRMSNLFFGSPAEEAQALAANTADPTQDCPVADVRTGASTMRLPAGGDASPSTLRYQASIARLARECRVQGPTMTIKVGVQGRVVVGPAGGPGQVEVPLRYALVHEGPEPKTIVTKLFRFPVAVGEGQTNVPFLHVEEDITFTVPSQAHLEKYVVYVGFDPGGERDPQAKKTRRSR
jgi:hypothetical protein